MFVAGFVLVVVVVGALAAAALRRWSEDEVHSVDHYRRSLGTLEEMREGPADHDENGVEVGVGNGLENGLANGLENDVENGHGNGNGDENGGGESAFGPPGFRAGKPMVRPIDPDRPVPEAPPIAAFVSTPPIPRVHTAQPRGTEDEAPAPVIRFDDLAHTSRVTTEDEAPAPVIRFDDLAHTAQLHGTDDEAPAPVIRFDDLADPTPTRTTTEDEAPVIRFDDLADPTPTRTTTEDEAPMIRFDDLAHTAQSHTTDDEAPVIRFDDLAQPNPNPSQTDDEAEAAVEPEQVSFFGESKRSWHRVRQVIDASNRQLGAPIAAIGAAALLIVVLVLTGLHSANAPHHTQTSATALGKPVHRNHGSPRPSGSTRSTAPSTTTTTAPVVSAPNVSTNSSATYQVASGNFTLALSASHGQCWIRATDASGNVLFNGTLSEGQSQSVSASGPVTIVAGAPSVFTATVNGSPVSLPAGALAPLTLKFVSAVSTSA